MNKPLIQLLRFPFIPRQHLLPTFRPLIMTVKNQNQVSTILTIILLMLIVFSGVFLAVYLYLSPSPS